MCEILVWFRQLIKVSLYGKRNAYQTLNTLGDLGSYLHDVNLLAFIKVTEKEQEQDEVMKFLIGQQGKH